MAQQTAVEWLVEQIIKYKLVPEGTHHDNVLFNKAKQMEKEQIIDAYDAGLFDGTMDDVNDRMHKQYYNETFK